MNIHVNGYDKRYDYDKKNFFRRHSIQAAILQLKLHCKYNVKEDCNLQFLFVMCTVPESKKNNGFLKSDPKQWEKRKQDVMKCVHDKRRLGYGYDDAGDELLAGDVVCRQQWRLLPVPDVRRILRRLAGVYVRRVDQQADILAGCVHLHDLYSYVHVYFRLHRSCGLCHGLRGCVDNDVLQGDLCRPCCVCFLSPSSSR